MYCSRLCNHKAAWARRSAKAKAQVDTESSPSRRELVSFTARAAPPSLWQRLRKRFGDVVATIKYLITASIDEYP
jgi:hypothetical protein